MKYNTINLKIVQIDSQLKLFEFTTNLKSIQILIILELLYNLFKN